MTRFSGGFSRRRYLDDRRRLDKPKKAEEALPAWVSGSKLLKPGFSRWNIDSDDLPAGYGPAKIGAVGDRFTAYDDHVYEIVEVRRSVVVVVDVISRQLCAALPDVVVQFDIEGSRRR